VLEPDDDAALEVIGVGGIRVTGGGIVVNSDDADAVVLASAGDIVANQIRVVGGVDDTGSGSSSRRSSRAGRRFPTRSPTCPRRTSWPRRPPRQRPRSRTSTVPSP
jgi:hypothetical protein